MSKLSGWLLAVLVLALAVRLYHVDSLPSILNRDEAALAYNALLLHQTGHDEWGRSWPVALESFGDYKLIGYPLLITGVFQVLGYSDLAVRLPSVIAGVVIVGLAYVWMKRDLKNNHLALVAAGIVSLTPVFWFYSRTAFEANVGLAWFILLMYLLWWPAKKRPYLTDLLAIGVSVGAVFTYNTPLLLLPFIICLLPLQRGIFAWQKWIFPVLGLGIVGVIAARVLLPLSAQKSGITIFSDETTQQQAAECRQQLSGLSQKTLGHKYVFWARVMVNNTLKSVSPTFLVTAGGSHPWHQLPTWGHLSWSIYILGWVGITTSAGILVKQRQLFSQGKLSSEALALLLLGISLAPAIITVDAPHATRSLLFFFIWVWFSVKALNWLSHLSIFKARQKWWWPMLYLIFLTEAVIYGQNYFGKYPLQQGAFQPGLDQIVMQLEQENPQVPIAVVDGGGYQYILVAWYLKLPPAVFFETVSKQLPDRIGFKYGEKIKNYHFIAKATDQQPAEKILIEWDNSVLEWRVTRK